MAHTLSHTYHLANPELNDTLKYIKKKLGIFFWQPFSTQITSEVVTDFNYFCVSDGICLIKA